LIQKKIGEQFVTRIITVCNFLINLNQNNIAFV